MNTPINHIGFILDGNRRFAKDRNISYDQAYEIAAEKVTNLVEWLLIENRANVLSVYALSLDNVRKRLPIELEPIYRVQIKTYEKWLDSRIMLDNGIRVQFVGEKNLLPGYYKDACLDLEQQTKECSRKIFYILVAYSGGIEISRAADMFRIIEPAGVNDIDRLFYKRLYVKEPVDLVIRTAGEQRLSDFLPYQSAYAEFVFIKKHFPDITKEDIDTAIGEFSGRNRNFGE